MVNIFIESYKKAPAEIVLEMVWGPLFLSGRRKGGVTAARVLFQRKWGIALLRAFGRTTAFIILTALWLTITAIPVGLIATAASFMACLFSIIFSNAVRKSRLIRAGVALQGTGTKESSWP